MWHDFSNQYSLKYLVCNRIFSLISLFRALKYIFSTISLEFYLNTIYKIPTTLPLFALNIRYLIYVHKLDREMLCNLSISNYSAIRFGSKVSLHLIWNFLYLHNISRRSTKICVFILIIDSNWCKYPLHVSEIYIIRPNLIIRNVIIPNPNMVISAGY